MMELTFFLMMVLLLTSVFLAPSRRKKEATERLSVYLDGEKPVVDAVKKASKQGKGPSPFKGLAVALWGRLTEWSKNKLPVKHADKLEKKLQKAGSPLKMTSVDFRLIQFLSLIGVGGFYGVFSFLLHLSEVRAVLFVAVGLVYGGLMPTLLLNSRIKRRTKEALRELPDFVDLLTVSLEAGLGFDSALSKVIDKQKGVLADEFRLCLDEIRLGKTRREGLMGIKNRLEVEDVTTLLNSVIRAEKLGVGMVQVLRVQALEVRQKRRQRAEEQAMKAPIKMLFPLVFFIFPSLFIIILGPAVIQIMHTFGSKNL